jgi:hypothetical protein
VVYGPKSAISAEQHEAIISHETNSERKAYYRLCWFLGGSNSDMALLRAESIDWERRTVTFIRFEDTGPMPPSVRLGVCRGLGITAL